MSLSLCVSVSLCVPLCLCPHSLSLSVSLCVSFLCLSLSVSCFSSPKGVWPREVEFKGWHQCPSSGQGHLHKHRTSCRAEEGGGRLSSGTTLSPPSLSQAGAGSYPVQPRETAVFLTPVLYACSRPLPSTELQSQGPSRLDACPWVSSQTPAPTVSLSGLSVNPRPAPPPGHHPRVAPPSPSPLARALALMPGPSSIAAHHPHSLSSPASLPSPPLSSPRLLCPSAAPLPSGLLAPSLTSHQWQPERSTYFQIPLP